LLNSKLYNSEIIKQFKLVVYVIFFEFNKILFKKMRNFLLLILLSFVLFACGKEKNIFEIKEYHIVCKQNDLDNIFSKYKEDLYIPITISCGNDTIKKAKLRVRGDTSREEPKKSIKVKLSDPFPGDNTKVFNFNAEYTDKSYIRQFLSSLIMRDAGIKCFTSSYAKLYVNNKFYGLYLMVENIDNKFLKEHNLSEKGNLYKAKKDGACLSLFDNVDVVWEKKTNKDLDKNDLIYLINQINSVSDKDFTAFVRNTFVYDKLIKLVALNMLLANGSTYYHNYYLYHDTYGTGKWEIFPWDMDKTLSYYNWKPYIYHQTSSDWESNNVLIERMLLDKEIFADIKSMIKELSEKYVNYSYMESTITNLETTLAESVEKDKTDKIKDLKTWKNTINNERDFFKNNSKLLLDQINKMPLSFKLNKTYDIIVENPFFSWSQSISPKGKEINYDFYLSKDFLFKDSLKTIIVKNLKDTCYTYTNKLSEGKYFWKVVANDKEYYTEGFNTKNIFYVKKPVVLKGEINKNIIITEENSPYLIDGDVIVKPGIKIQINEGATIIFKPDATLWVKGQIIAKGTEKKPVIFRPINNKSSWSSIYFEHASDSCVLQSVIIEDGVVNSKYTNLYIENSKIIITNKQLHISQERRLCLVWVHQGKFTCKNNYLTSKGKGEGMDINYANSLVENSVFYNLPDAIEFINVTDGVIKGNKVENSPDDAIDLNGCYNVIITNNILLNSKDKAISIGTEQYGASKNIYVEKNLIVGNNVGIAIKDSSTAFITNNTLYNNNVSIVAYKKREGYIVGGNAVVKNSIISKSNKEDIKVDNLSSISISYSLCDSKQISGTANIYNKPAFISESGNNFYLKEKSPCINTGIPSILNYDGTNSDIGAFSRFESQLVINEINYLIPSNSNSGEWVELYNPNNIELDISEWKLHFNKKELIFPIGTKVLPYSYVIIYNSPLKFDELFKHNYYTCKYIYTNLEFNAFENELILFDKFDNKIDFVSFKNTAPWPVVNIETGGSLQLKTPLFDNSNSKNWDYKQNNYTPGDNNNFFIK